VLAAHFFSFLYRPKLHSRGLKSAPGSFVAVVANWNPLYASPPSRKEGGVS